VAGVTQDPEAWARLGAKIREQREALGMSRRQLSEVAGVSEKSIQVAEEGRTPRARWPQSLRLIESALRWAPDSMLGILEGGEPEPRLDLFSLELKAEEGADGSLEQVPLFPSADVPLTGDRSGMEVEFPNLHSRSSALARLPKALRAPLAEILTYGSRARNYGADPDVAEEYERAVEALIIDLASRRPTYRSSGDPGHLAPWSSAMRMDPVLRREKEERAHIAERERRRAQTELDRLNYAVGRTPVVGGISEAQILREIQKLAAEVGRLSDKVDAKDKDAPGE
jgi:transcriptional regulator with XRE-family HTH domain